METLLVSKNNGIARISFNRPQAMNSFEKTMSQELEEVTEMIRLDSSVRVVLLNGTGNLFMAGGDIRFFNDTLDTMPQGVRKMVRTLNASIINLMKMPKPVVASVHGSVAGVGMSFMMACDLVIAAADTKFTMAYSGIGITPDGGASYNLPRIVGTKKAMELILLSELFDAKTAVSLGLINWAVPKESLAEETDKLLTKLASGPTQSFARTKKLINHSWEKDLESQLEKEGEAFEQCTSTRDFKNGVYSFLKKTKPEFVGE